MTDTPDAGPSEEKSCVECKTVLSGNAARYSRCSTCRGARRQGKATGTATLPPPDDAPDAGGFDTDGVEPVTIPFDRARPAAPPHREFYWCGCLEDCPTHAVTVGGISFPLWTGEVREEAPGRFKYVDRTHRGQVHHLTDRNVALVKERLVQRVVRNGEIISTLDVVKSDGTVLRRFVPQDGDRSLGEFVYMVRVRHRADRPMADPPTMIPRE